MDLSFWLDLLTTGIPSGAIMFTGLFALVIAHGGFGVHMEGKPKQRLTNFGFVLLFLGFVLTFIIVIFQIWEKYTDSVKSSFNTLKDFSIAFPYKIEVSIFVVVIIFAGFLREQLSGFYKKRAKNFRLKSEFVLSKDKLNILVENISDEKIYCLARISKIIINGVEKNVKKYNPDGYYMRWDKDRQSEVDHTLIPGIPRVIYFLRTYGDEISFELNGDNGDTLEYGKCEVTIDYYRMKNGGNFVKFDNFVGMINTYLTDKREARIEIIESPRFSSIQVLRKRLGL